MMQDQEDDLIKSWQKAEEQSELSQEMLFQDADYDIFETRKKKFVLKDEYINSIKSIRSLMVLLKRSNKQRDILREHTSLAPIIDVPTCWNSKLAMLKRYIRIGKSLRKAAIDSPEIRSKMVQDEKSIKAIKGLIIMLEPFDRATKLLSKHGVNLHSADIILEMLLKKLEKFLRLRSRTIFKIRERRNVWSDIVLYLKDDTEDITLYEQPADSEIIKLYEQVNF